MSGFPIHPVEAYANRSSVTAGSVISFHVSVQGPPAPKAGSTVLMQIYRSAQFIFDNTPFGVQTSGIYDQDYRGRLSLISGAVPVFESTFPAINHTKSLPPYSSKIGCDWPIATTWKVPSNTRSGVFIARFIWKNKLPTYALFVVRPLISGTFEKIVCQLSVNTYQAYNTWGGQCFYDFGAPSLNAVSFNRPCQLWDYILYDQLIVAWLERNFPQAEYCTNIDLHEDAALLNPYCLFISGGHDEYWSAKMRDRIEAFAESGGNVLFLGGNICYREVTLGNGLLTKTALKDAVWRELGRPEASTIGVNFSGGRWSQFLPRVGYQVKRSAHWAFENTGLLNERGFGQREGIIGYETDAAVYGTLGEPTTPTPANFVTLAEVKLPDWTDNGPNARATFGLYRRGKGIVVTAGSTGWGQGLKQDNFETHQITHNLVARLRQRTCFGNIYTINAEGNLCWYRDFNQDGTGDLGTARIIARGGWNAYRFVFCGGDGVIYAVSTEGNLLWFKDESRNGNGTLSGPKIIGRGGWNLFRQLFSGGNGIIYAVNNDGNLLFYQDVNRNGTGEVGGSNLIGSIGLNDIKHIFSGGYGIIYAIDASGNLLFYRDYNRDGTGNIGAGSIIGKGGWNTLHRVFAGDDGIIYATSTEGDLLWYKDFKRDGTGDVGAPRIIGKGGWNKMHWAEGELF